MGISNTRVLSSPWPEFLLRQKACFPVRVSLAFSKLFKSEAFLYWGRTKLVY